MSSSSFTSTFVNSGRGGYNGPASQEEDDSFTMTPPMNFGRGGYNRGGDDDEAEDGRGGYN